MVDGRVGLQTPSLEHGFSGNVSVEEMGLSLFLLLGESHIYGLVSDDATVHFRDGFSGFFWRGETNEAESSAASSCRHHLCMKHAASQTHQLK